MSQQRKVRRKSELGLKDENKKSKEPLMTRISRIAIILVFVATVVSLAYTVIIYSGAQ